MSLADYFLALQSRAESNPEQAVTFLLSVDEWQEFVAALQKLCEVPDHGLAPGTLDAMWHSALETLSLISTYKQPAILLVKQKIAYKLSLQIPSHFQANNVFTTVLAQFAECAELSAEDMLQHLGGMKPLVMLMKRTLPEGLEYYLKVIAGACGVEMHAREFLEKTEGPVTLLKLLTTHVEYASWIHPVFATCARHESCRRRLYKSFHKAFGPLLLPKPPFAPDELLLRQTFKLMLESPEVCNRLSSSQIEAILVSLVDPQALESDNLWALDCLLWISRDAKLALNILKSKQATALIQWQPDWEVSAAEQISEIWISWITLCAESAAALKQLAKHLALQNILAVEERLRQKGKGIKYRKQLQELWQKWCRPWKDECGLDWCPHCEPLVTLLGNVTADTITKSAVMKTLQHRFHRSPLEMSIFYSSSAECQKILLGLPFHEHDEHSNDNRHASGAEELADIPLQTVSTPMLIEASEEDYQVAASLLLQICRYQPLHPSEKSQEILVEEILFFVTFSTSKWPQVAQATLLDCLLALVKSAPFAERRVLGDGAFLLQLTLNCREALGVVATHSAMFLLDILLYAGEIDDTSPLAVPNLVICLCAMIRNNLVAKPGISLLGAVILANIWNLHAADPSILGCLEENDAISLLIETNGRACEMHVALDVGDHLENPLEHRLSILLAKNTVEHLSIRSLLSIVQSHYRSLRVDALSKLEELLTPSAGREAYIQLCMTQDAPFIILKLLTDNCSHREAKNDVHNGDREEAEEHIAAEIFSLLLQQDPESIAAREITSISSLVAVAKTNTLAANALSWIYAIAMNSRQDCLLVVENGATTAVQSGMRRGLHIEALQLAIRMVQCADTSVAAALLCLPDMPQITAICAQASNDHPNDAATELAVTLLTLMTESEEIISMLPPSVLSALCFSGVSLVTIKLASQLYELSSKNPPAEVQSELVMDDSLAGFQALLVQGLPEVQAYVIKSLIVLADSGETCRAMEAAGILGILADSSRFETDALNLYHSLCRHVPELFLSSGCLLALLHLIQHSSATLSDTHIVETIDTFADLLSWLVTNTRTGEAPQIADYLGLLRGIVPFALGVLRDFGEQTERRDGILSALRCLEILGSSDPECSAQLILESTLFAEFAMLALQFSTPVAHQNQEPVHERGMSIDLQLLRSLSAIIGGNPQVGISFLCSQPGLVSIMFKILENMSAIDSSHSRCIGNILKIVVSFAVENFENAGYNSSVGQKGAVFQSLSWLFEPHAHLQTWFDVAGQGEGHSGTCALVMLYGLQHHADLFYEYLSARQKIDAALNRQNYLQPDAGASLAPWILSITKRRFTVATVPTLSLCMLELLQDVRLAPIATENGICEALAALVRFCDVNDDGTLHALGGCLSILSASNNLRPLFLKSSFLLAIRDWMVSVSNVPNPYLLMLTSVNCAFLAEKDVFSHELADRGIYIICIRIFELESFLDNTAISNASRILRKVATEPLVYNAIEEDIPRFLEAICVVIRKSQSQAQLDGIRTLRSIVFILSGLADGITQHTIWRYILVIARTKDSPTKKYECSTAEEGVKLLNAILEAVSVDCDVFACLGLLEWQVLLKQATGAAMGKLLSIFARKPVDEVKLLGPECLMYLERSLEYPEAMTGSIAFFRAVDANDGLSDLMSEDLMMKVIASLPQNDSIPNGSLSELIDCAALIISRVSDATARLLAPVIMTFLDVAVLTEANLQGALSTAVPPMPLEYSLIQMSLKLLGTLTRKGDNELSLLAIPAVCRSIRIFAVDPQDTLLCVVYALILRLIATEAAASAFIRHGGKDVLLYTLKHGKAEVDFLSFKAVGLLCSQFPLNANEALTDDVALLLYHALDAKSPRTRAVAKETMRQLATASPVIKSFQASDSLKAAMNRFGELHPKKSGSSTSFPPHWIDPVNKLQIVNLEQSKKEFGKCVSFLSKRNRPYAKNVSKVLRIQNPQMYFNYCTSRVQKQAMYGKVSEHVRFMWIPPEFLKQVMEQGISSMFFENGKGGCGIYLHATLPNAKLGCKKAYVVVLTACTGNTARNVVIGDTYQGVVPPIDPNTNLPYDSLSFPDNSIVVYDPDCILIEQIVVCNLG